MSSNERIIVQVDPDLKEFIPEFLKNRRDDVAGLRDAVARAEWETVRRIGHRLRGSGGGYGFDPITDLGAQLEAATEPPDAALVRTLIDDLATYLERVVVV